MREMGLHSQGDSRQLCRWRDIASNTRGRISDLAVPLAPLRRKRFQLHKAELHSTPALWHLYLSCAHRNTKNATSYFRRSHDAAKPHATKYPFCRLWLSRAKFADPPETRLPSRRGRQQDADPIMWLNVAQVSP